MSDADVKATIGADVTPLQRSLGQASGMLRGFASNGSRSLAQFGKTIATGMGFGAGLVIIQGLNQAFSQFVGTAMTFNSQLEQSGIAFTTMLGSAEKSRAFLNELQQFAAKTPFEFTGLVKSTQQLMAYGFAAKEVVPILTAVGDAVSGLGAGQEGISRITRALGQMQAKTRVMAQEMQQLTETGIPAWDILAEKMGLTVPKLQDMVSKGLVPADQAITALTQGKIGRASCRERV